ncbi:hypothetical protein NUW58_g4263 [Xylaria curta]|uniref:Uncharacterized protein n=1 Tax=Xylaria curta TaxID=42375 RepID=A0ACC1P7L3_9PEZI|nr:hypothetical protein NUW58_g4263 [Xylaria curta]
MDLAICAVLAVVELTLSRVSIMTDDNNVILGQELKKFRAHNPIELQLDWSRRWPDTPFIRYFSIAGKEALVVNSLAAHKAVLQTHVYDFVKPPFFTRLAGEIVGKGLLFAEGEDHRRERKLLAGPFSVPMTDTLSKSTMHTVGVTVLGVDLDALLSIYPRSFQELYSTVFDQEPLGGLIWVINAFVPIRRFVPLKANKRFIQANQDLREMLRDIVEKRNADLRDGTFVREMGESRDLLTYMLEESVLQQQQTGREPWAVDDIVDHLLNFTAAGHETTADAISWGLYVLSTTHEIQDQLRTEIRAFLMSHPEPTYEKINGLPYLHNFTRELLRVYSPAITSPRQASKDIVIEGVYIPKGTQVDLQISLMHHRQEIWGPDASNFNPDRWNKLAGDSASPYAFQAFIQGPRMCPGKNFAMIEIKVMLIELVSKWRFLGIERWDSAVMGEGSGEKKERDLLVGGEEAVGRGVKLANPSLTFRPEGLSIRGGSETEVICYKEVFQYVPLILLALGRLRYNDNQSSPAIILSERDWAGTF